MITPSPYELISVRDAFVQALARDLVLQGKGPDTAARLARATWAELYPEPHPVTEAPKAEPWDPKRDGYRIAASSPAHTPESIKRDPYCPRDATPEDLQRYADAANRITARATVDPDDLYHAAKAGK